MKQKAATILLAALALLPGYRMLAQKAPDGAADLRTAAPERSSGPWVFDAGRMPRGELIPSGPEVYTSRRLRQDQLARIPCMYQEALLQIMDENKEAWRSVLKARGVYRNLQRLFRGYAKVTDDVMVHDRNLAGLLIVAWVNDDYETAHALLQELGKVFTPEPFHRTE